jgi:hypothetical protein
VDAKLMDVHIIQLNPNPMEPRCQSPIKAVFRSEIFGGNIPVALSLLFGKIYPTMN